MLILLQITNDENQCKLKRDKRKKKHQTNRINWQKVWAIFRCLYFLVFFSSFRLIMFYFLYYFIKEMEVIKWPSVGEMKNDDNKWIDKHFWCASKLQNSRSPAVVILDLFRKLWKKSEKHFDLARIAKKNRALRFTFSSLKLQQKSILFTWVLDQLPFSSYCEFERDLISLKNALSSSIIFALSTALISITND